MWKHESVKHSQLRKSYQWPWSRADDAYNYYFFIIRHVNRHFGKTARLRSQLIETAAKHHFSFLLKRELWRDVLWHSHTWRRHPTPPYRSSPSLLRASHSRRLETQLPIKHKAESNPAPARPPMAATHQPPPMHVRWTGGLGRSFIRSPRISQLN